MRVFAMLVGLLAAGAFAQAPKQKAPAGPGIENPSHAAALPPDWTGQLASRHEAISTEKTRIHVLRLRPGDDLLGAIRAYVQAKHIQAAVVLSGVGSLTQASIRYANQPDANVRSGHFEIVSITGTVEEGGEHVHLSISTEQGETIGGHLESGCRIYTTAEVTLEELEGVRFGRELDKEGSGWEELKIYPVNQ